MKEMKSENYTLHELIEEVLKGRIVLPEFQRNFVWDANNIKELLVSILNGYFIGTMLMLEPLSENEALFALRLIEGVDKVNNNATIQPVVKVLLDGQQRTTALFYAIYEPNIPLRNSKYPYKFFLNIDKLLEKKFEEAIEVISAYRTRDIEEKKKRDEYVTFRDFLNPEELTLRLLQLNRFRNNIDIIKESTELANKFKNYRINIVQLPKDIDLEVIAETFERINRTGVPLSVFDLVVARLYKYEIKLRDLLEKAKKEYEAIRYIEEDLKKPEYILKVVALIRGKDIRRKSILNIEPENFEYFWERACKSLDKALSRIKDIRDGYGVLHMKWIPYEPMLILLAAILDFIDNKPQYKAPETYKKIDSWYWSSVFNERYQHSVDTMISKDFVSLKKWIENDSNVPEFIQKFNINEIDLETDNKNSAIYKGTLSLIILKGSLDFQTGEPPQFIIEKIQEDHIFPKSKFRHEKIDTVLNKTLISTNAQKSNKKPSEYFKELQGKHGKDKLFEILESHLIPKEALEDLLNDYFEPFLEKRKKDILKEIEERASLLSV